MSEFYVEPAVTILHGDCVQLLPEMPLADLIIVDPPYGETAMEWDRRSTDWIAPCVDRLSHSGSLWLFGSLRSMLFYLPLLQPHLTIVQDVIWEKHNGTNCLADRFRRVHEYAVQLRHSDARWRDVYKAPVKTRDAVARTIRRKQKPTHWSKIGSARYVSVDGGPRLVRSVVRVRSCHGHAIHPSQKPTALLSYLIEYSCPSGGLVIDPFMGSGSTLVAARAMGRRAIGIEREEEYCRKAAASLAQSVLVPQAEEAACG